MTDQEKEFTIRDRRAAASDAGSDRTGKEAADENAAEIPAGGGPQPESGADEALDFSTFVISLASSAQMNLGAIPHPETNQTVQNFPAAKQMIDILAMLKEKTKGNRTEDESALMDQVLFNLQLHYVRAVEGQKKSGG